MAEIEQEPRQHYLESPLIWMCAREFTASIVGDMERMDALRSALPTVPRKIPALVNVELLLTTRMVLSTQVTCLTILSTIIIIIHIWLLYYTPKTMLCLN